MLSNSTDAWEQGNSQENCFVGQQHGQIGKKLKQVWVPGAPSEDQCKTADWAMTQIFVGTKAYIMF